VSAPTRPPQGSASRSQSATPGIVGQCREPLFRNGHALNASALIASAIGLGFWVLAAHHYPMAVVGRNSVAVLVLMFIGGAAQLNLASALVRFLPGAGRKASGLVASTYAVSAAVAVVLATGFLLLIPYVAPELNFLVANWWLALWFTLSSAVWTVFVLEDGALTGLRRTPWVPVENAGFSILKAALVVPIAAVTSGAGIVVSWMLAAICTVIPTNCFLFGRAIPRHVRQSQPGTTVTFEDLRRFVPYDYVGSLCWLAATSLLPLVVIARVGASTSASFSLAWIIAYSLYLVSINLGSSLVAETSADPTTLHHACRRVRIHLLKVVGPGVAVIVIGAPVLLRLMGSAYAAEGATVLRLLAISALPFIFTATAISAYRTRRDTRPVAIINAAVFTMVAVLSVVLLPMIGIAGVGVAWVAAQSSVAVVLVVIEHRRVAADSGPQPVISGGLAMRIIEVATRFALPARIVDLGGRLRARLSEPHSRKLILAALAEIGAVPVVATESSRRLYEQLRILPSGSDRVVAMLRQHDGFPGGVVKVPRSERAVLEFCAEQTALRLLVSDSRLGPWRSMLPEAYLTFTPAGCIALERVIPGTDAAGLVRRTPPLLPTVMNIGLCTIGELHRRTAHTVVVDNAIADRWFAPAIAVLRQTHPSGHVPRSQVKATDQLDDLLRRAIDGRHLGVGWVHGDFTPGNVMVARDASQVRGILDWGQACPDSPPDLDVVLWLTALECQVRGWSMGRLVCQVLAAPTWPDSSLLQVSRKTMGPFGIGHHQLVLWCWLLHVTGNLGKSERYHRNPWWWGANVEPVLRALAA
jgi:O-antigen/teichoic acid export membrane protein